MSKRPYLTPAPVFPKGPVDTSTENMDTSDGTSESVFAAHIRDNFAARRHRLEELCPAAHDLGTRFLIVLHPRIVGRQEALRGDRHGSIWRRALRGEDALPLEDLCRLVLEAPSAVGPALAVLAHAAGYTMLPNGAMEARALEAELRAHRRRVEEIEAAIEKTKRPGGSR